MKHQANLPDSASNEADELDTLFRAALQRELNVSAPKVALPQRQSTVDDAAAHRWRVRGGGPGGVSYSGFYLLYYVMNTSRSAWGFIPG